MDWQKIAEAVLPNLWVVLLPLVWTLLREQIGHVKDTRLQALLMEWVSAAEQMYGAGQGESKRKYVEQQATVNGVTIGQTQLEAAVHTLKTMGTAVEPMTELKAG